MALGAFVEEPQVLKLHSARVLTSLISTLIKAVSTSAGHTPVALGALSQSALGPRNSLQAHAETPELSPNV